MVSVEADMGVTDAAERRREVQVQADIRKRRRLDGDQAGDGPDVDIEEEIVARAPALPVANCRACQQVRTPPDAGTGSDRVSRKPA